MRSERVRHVGAGGALAHLLLVVVLALGVFVMHSVGHPDDASHSSSPSLSSVSAHHAEAPAENPAQDAPPASGPHDSGMSMDMTTLCVAVLGIWLLARLLRAAFGRLSDWLVRIHARLTTASAPRTPPRIPPDLAKLSVLRI